MESWKLYQKKNKIWEWVRKLKIAALALLGLILIIQVKLLINWMGESPAKLDQYAGFSNTEWKNQQINLFVNPNWLIGYDPESREVRYFKVDKSPNLNELGILSKQTKVYLDGYLIFNEDLDNPDGLSKKILAGVFKGEIQTNLSRWDLFRLWWGLRAGYLKYFQAENRLPETQILQERLKVSIYNGTQVTGLASELTEWVDNLGAEVIEVGNSDETIGLTRIEVFAPVGDYRVVERIEQILQTKASYIQQLRPQKEDIRILVGRNYLR